MTSYTASTSLPVAKEVMAGVGMGRVRGNSAGMRRYASENLTASARMRERASSSPNTTTTPSPVPSPGTTEGNSNMLAAQQGQGPRSPILPPPSPGGMGTRGLVDLGLAELGVLPVPVSPSSLLPVQRMGIVGERDSWDESFVSDYGKPLPPGLGIVGKGEVGGYFGNEEPKVGEEEEEERDVLDGLDGSDSDSSLDLHTPLP